MTGLRTSLGLGHGQSVETPVKILGTQAWLVRGDLNTLPEGVCSDDLLRDMVGLYKEICNAKQRHTRMSLRGVVYNGGHGEALRPNETVCIAREDGCACRCVQSQELITPLALEA